MRLTHLAPSRRRALALAVVPLAFVLANVVPGSSAGAATGGAVADPAVGPNATQERALGANAPVLAPDPNLPPAQSKSSGVTRAAVVAQSSPRVASGNGNLTHEVFGYAPYWELGNWQEWQMNLLSTIAYFGVSIDGGGNAVQGSDAGWNGWNSSNLTNLVNTAHASGIRVVLTIKCMDNPTINSIVSSPSNSQNAINNTIALVQQRGLDGVNVDFEGGASSSYPNIQSQYTSFVTSLTNQMHSAVQGSEVSVATYSGSASWDQGFMNISDLGKVVDAMFVMAYDMTFGNTPGNASADAPLNGWTYNDTLTVQQYVSKAPASKVILGAGYYGYKWCTNGTGPNAAIIGNGNGCPAQGVDTYASMFDDFNCTCTQNVQFGWDSTAASPWASWYSPSYGASRELYYEDSNSIGAKWDLVNSYGIRGGGIWALGYDTGRTELWSVIAQKFGPPAGYWMVARDGGVFPFGRAGGYGSTGNVRLNQPMVGMAGTQSGRGYWLVAADGGIFPFGDAWGYGSTGDKRLNKPIVGMAATPSGHGYWLVASDGGIFTFGDASFKGSTGAIRLNQPVVGMAPTSSGQGYWLVAADGGIFPFGDAGGFGSHGGSPLNQPIVGMAATPSGHGYFLVAADGGIFPYGDAVGRGSTGNMRLNQPIVGMATTASGGGYWLVAADGGIFTFGDAPFLGSTGGQHLNQPVVDMGAMALAH
ncbi:MAG TPA: glycosyl hydrolase family 18 protein [Candidatus Angelobacter sp.]|jgi:spore germination protein YaaH|nr:glycosyl hydrolase family 18 protein [Candidatus Angelobacter sp.]